MRSCTMPRHCRPLHRRRHIHLAAPELERMHHKAARARCRAGVGCASPIDAAIAQMRAHEFAPRLAALAWNDTPPRMYGWYHDVG